MNTDTSKITILLVEDAVVMRRIELKTLNSLGFENIVEASDGAAAVRLMESGLAPDLIISDWNMPKMDGYQLLCRVRADKQFEHVPFLMATGQGDKAQEQKAIDAGVSSFVAKPFNETELRSKIDEALGGKADDVVADEPPKCHVLEDGRVRLKVAHIQITDHIILGVLKHLITTGDLTPKYFALETECMPGWNPVQQSLDKGAVDAAFVLGPIAMDLFSYGAPIKLILLAHKNGSICVRNKRGLFVEPYPDFFKGKSFLIPHKMSVHHMLSHLFFRRIGLNPGIAGDGASDVFFEVVAPVKMQEFLVSNPDVAGFMVAEPLGTKAIAGGSAQLQFLSSELWDGHPCCVVAVRDALVEQHTDAIQEFTDMLVHAGQFVQKKPELAAEIGVSFFDPDKKLGLKVPILKNVLTEDKGIKTDDLFPDIVELSRMHDYMLKEMGIGKPFDINAFVDTRFAEHSCSKRASAHRPSRLDNSAETALGILVRGTGKQIDNAKSMLDMEGKYLMFSLDDQEFGIDIMKIREIVGMLPVRSIPQSPPYIKGVIDLRGKIITVLDLKARFGMGELTAHARNCIIVLESEGLSVQSTLGLAVDSVSEVIGIKSGDIDETAYFGASINTDHIKAMAKIDNGVKLLLNADHIMQGDLGARAAI